jgi:diketogulonate reductase-like aldo/keto reductase
LYVDLEEDRAPHSVADFQSQLPSEELLEICERSGKAPVACLQNGYSLIGRETGTRGLFPLLRRTGLGVQAIGAHSADMLTGPSGAEVSHAIAELDPALTELIGVAEGVAAGLGVPRSQVNVAWVLSHPEITTAPAGAESPEQVDDNLERAVLELPAEAIETLNAASDRFRDLLEEARRTTDASQQDRQRPPSLTGRRPASIHVRGGDGGGTIPVRTLPPFRRPNSQKGA